MSSRVIDFTGAEVTFDLSDRGLAYGDGVFETILVHADEPVWWSEHWQRLLRGASVLGISAPDENIVRTACHAMLKNVGQCVIKIILTRGSGGRGYAAPSQPEPRIILSVHPAPTPIMGGVHLRWCDVRLAYHPQLAGIKHLNRLEQVLARREWQDETIFDGLMCDNEDNVVCCTSTNVFAKISGQWFTPIVQRAGIAGIARAWVMQHWPQVQEAHLSRFQVEQSEAIFVCNAVRGILAVSCLSGRDLPAHSDILELQSQLAILQPAFAKGERNGT